MRRQSFPQKKPIVPLVDSSKYLGQVIKLLRKEKKMSQILLAQNAKIDRTTIARIECGRFRSLSLLNVERIAKALEVDLKTLLFKCESSDKTFNCRSQVSHTEFALDYPEEGFRIVSFLPKRKEFFFGKIEIKPQRTIVSAKLPHPEQIYLYVLEGKFSILLNANEFLLKVGECLTFSGAGDYELYNPDLLKVAVALFMTYPSFL